ncbi:MAG: hypothetical protein Q9187_002407 [Circinaria calcarea]
MLDPLTAATSVAGVLSLTIQVSEILYKQIHTFKNAPKDAHELLGEIKSLSDVLASVESFLKEQAAKGHSFREASVLVNAIRGCSDKITALKEKLEKLGNKRGIAQLLERGKWLFEHEEHVEIVTALHRYLGMFQITLSTSGIDLLSKSADEVAKEVNGLKSVMTAITPDPLEALKKSQQLDDIFQLCLSLSNVSNSVAEVSSTMKRWDTKWQNKESQEILDWISPLNSWAKQQDTLSRKQEGTCQWLFDDPIFQAWLNGSNRTLWCPGLPGAGKTVLVYVSISLKTLSKFEVENVSLSFIYCNYKENQSTVDLIGTLLQQVIAKRSSVPAAVKTLYEQHREKNTKLSLIESASLLHSELSKFSRAFVVVDALDETDEQDGTRSQLMSELRALPPNTHLLVTSRHVPSVQAGLNEPQRLEIRASDKDVRLYLDDRIEREDRLKKHIRADLALRDLVINSVADKAQGMFLLAQLHIESLSKKQTRKAVRTALESLPQRLDQTYEEAMERVLLQEEDDALLAKKVLSWISYARRPMTVLEIQHATAVELDTKVLDEDELVDEEILVSVCAGLVTIDQESNIIRLVHYTTQEWFERNRETLLPNAQSDITLTCLTYLSYDIFRTSGSTSDDEGNQLKVGNPLLEYVACNWGFHAFGEPEHSIRTQILEFLAPNFVIAAYPAYPAYPYWSANWSIRLAPPLCIAAFFGLTKIAMLLISDKVDLEAKDSKARTPLHVASVYGQESTAQLLIDHGAETAAQDSFGSTPLHLAAEAENITIALLLLEHGAEVNAQNNLEDTPLFRAAEMEDIPMVKLLLEHGAKINARNRYQETPIFWPVRNGNISIVKLLLEHGAEIHIRDKKQETLIFWAVKWGEISMVKLLLEHGAEINARNSRQETPIFWPVRNGNISIVKLLLEHGAEIHARNKEQETLIFWAVKWGEISMVKLLLEHGAEINARNSRQETPIFLGLNRDISITKLLLEHGAEVNAQNSLEDTPLFRAVEMEDIPMVKWLLEHGAEINARSSDQETPLFKAVKKGKISMVKLLLQHGAEINARDSYQETPIFTAVRTGEISIVKWLLEHGAEINIGDSDQETPILTAVRTGEISMVKWLLEHGAEINARNSSQETPIFLGLNRDISITKLLLEHGAEVNARSKHSIVLHWISGYGSIELMELVLKHGADVEAEDGDGDTPLQWPAESGKIEAVKLLLRAGANPKATGNQGTPLDWAIRMGHEDVIKILAPLTLDLGSKTIAEALHLASHGLTLDLIKGLSIIAEKTKAGSVIEVIRGTKSFHRPLFGKERKVYFYTTWPPLRHQ